MLPRGGSARLWQQEGGRRTQKRAPARPEALRGCTCRRNVNTHCAARGPRGLFLKRSVSLPLIRLHSHVTSFGGGREVVLTGSRAPACARVSEPRLPNSQNGGLGARTGRGASVAGTLVTCAESNKTCNGRTLIPLLPPCGQVAAGSTVTARACGSLPAHGPVLRGSAVGAQAGTRTCGKRRSPALPRRDPTYCSAASPCGFPKASRGVHGPQPGHVGAAPAEAEPQPRSGRAAAGGSAGVGRRERPTPRRLPAAGPAPTPLPVGAGPARPPGSACPLPRGSQPARGSSEA